MQAQDALIDYASDGDDQGDKVKEKYKERDRDRMYNSGGKVRSRNSTYIMDFHTSLLCLAPLCTAINIFPLLLLFSFSFLFYSCQTFYFLFLSFFSLLSFYIFPNII